MKWKDIKNVVFPIGGVCCVIFAGILCIMGKEGWGWFLFFGVCLSSTIEFSK